MTEAAQQPNTTTAAAMNQYYISDSVIKMRLDTAKLLADLEAFYKGARVIGYTEQNGAIIPQFEEIGQPRMNSKGIQDMMSWLSGLFNPQTVQGNKEKKDFEIFMCNLQADIASNLMDKMPDYDIDESDYNGIIDKTLAAADMFFSRTIDNLERDSYANTMKSIERVGEQGGLSKWLPFGK